MSWNESHSYTHAFWLHLSWHYLTGLSVKRALYLIKRALYIVKQAIYTHMLSHPTPIGITSMVLVFCQKSPVYYQKSRVHFEKSPVYSLKSPVHLEKSRVCFQKSCVCFQKSRVYSERPSTMRRLIGHGLDKWCDTLQLQPAATHCNTSNRDANAPRLCIWKWEMVCEMVHTTFALTSSQVNHATHSYTYGLATVSSID